MTRDLAETWGCCELGTYDETGLFHDHTPDSNFDGQSGDDDHDVLTGSTPQGTLQDGVSTCDDWTSTTASGRPTVGHIWPRENATGSAASWASAHDSGGCAAGVNFSDAMDGGSNGTVGFMGGMAHFIVLPNENCLSGEECRPNKRPLFLTVRVAYTPIFRPLPLSWLRISGTVITIKEFKSKGLWVRDFRCVSGKNYDTIYSSFLCL